uniref:SusE domain-containing protein n=1 Tax=Flavobacterium sp. TaxID=239 RepID=UPI00404A2BC7
MKLNLKKISSFFLLALFLGFSSCEDDENLVIVTPDAAFELEEPAINNVYLNFGLPQNPAFTIAWTDNLTGSSNYTVEMAFDAEFTSVSTLGSTSANNFTISVEDLNDAIAAAGATNFADIAIFLRVNSGSVLSNSVLYFVTTYPTDPPVITSPSSNDSFELTIASSEELAMTVSWTDAALASDLGLDINYAIQAAVAGSEFASPVSLGNVSNNSTLEVTHSDLNAVALGLGFVAETAGNIDLRIVATNSNLNEDVLTRTSSLVTISVTPYLVSFPNLYLVGDATTPGWNNNNNNTPVFRNQNLPNNYVYTGYFNSGAFKMLEVKGAWQPQWGTNDGSTLAVNPGGGSDPGTFNVSTAGYYTYNFTTVGESGSFTVTPFDATSAPTYTTMGIIGAAIGGWGDGDEINFTQDPNNPHLWFALGVTFTNGQEFLIRANDGWNEVWRYNGSTELYGNAFLAGGGDNFPFNADTGNYDVWFNDLDGSYILILQ